MNDKSIPTELIELADGRWETFRAAAERAGVDTPQPEDLPGAVKLIWGCSEFVSQSCIRQPALLVDLLASGDLNRSYEPDDLRSKVRRGLDGVGEDAELMRALRLLKRRELVRVAWRDLSGCAGFEETVRDTSAFADAVLSTTLERVHGWQAQRLGQPLDQHESPQFLIVMALGKLGASELNFSSDIDLILGFPEAGRVSSSARSISNEEFFVKLARRFINLLSKQTEDGFVFRVDMRLRPFGASGPLVASLNALEDYYQIHGRDWERYALIRARPVAGDLAKGWDLLERLRPFVYRRYLDFGALESLRDMKTLISAEVARKGMQDNVKLGQGGIREVEFVGQAFQMVRGGRLEELRGRQILNVLQKLGNLSLLPEYAVSELQEAYVFLRNTEHRLQQVDDQQTHTLPQEPLARLRLAAGMGFDDWETFAAVLAKHRARVQSHFDQVFGASEEGPADDSDGINALWEGTLSTEQARDVLKHAGYPDAEAVLERIDALRRAYAVRALSERGRVRMSHLIPVLLRAVAQRGEQAETLHRVLGIIESIARRSVYLALLIERPLALSQLLRLCEASPLIARQIARHPLLLDELLDARTLYAPLDRAALELDAHTRLAQISAGDTEQEMDSLRHFKQSNVLRVAAADVSGSIPLSEVSTHLSEIAEVSLGRILKIAWRDLCERYGEPCCGVGADRVGASFTIVGYGKLGGVELGYASDLDLVFLHDSAGEAQQTAGPHSIDNALFFSRLAQRIIHFLSTHTAGGALYQTDARLRPSGSGGLLVTGIDSFADYQAHQAWTWEHQALVRARAVAGNDALAGRFRTVRTEVLLKTRDGETLRREVREMRDRMRAELGSTDAGKLDIKQDPGGIADIEFMVQYGTLRWAPKLRNYLQFTDNIRLLRGFAETGLMAESDVELLVEAYGQYRQRAHGFALQEQSAILDGGEFEELRAGVLDVWHRLMEA